MDEERLELVLEEKITVVEASSVVKATQNPLPPAALPLLPLKILNPHLPLQLPEPQLSKKRPALVRARLISLQPVHQLPDLPHPPANVSLKSPKPGRRQQISNQRRLQRDPLLINLLLLHPIVRHVHPLRPAPLQMHRLHQRRQDSLREAPKPPPTDCLQSQK